MHTSSLRPEMSIYRYLIDSLRPDRPSGVSQGLRRGFTSGYDIPGPPHECV